MANRSPHRRRNLSGNAVAIRWQDDPLVMKRVELVASLMLRKLTASQMVDMVNRYPGVQPPGETTSLRTLYRDRERVKEMWLEQSRASIKDAQAMAIAELDRVIRQADETWDSATVASPNRASSLSVKVAAITEKNKIQGLHQPDVMLVQQNIQVDHIDIVVEELRQLIPDSRKIIEMIDAVAGEKREQVL